MIDSILWELRQRRTAIIWWSIGSIVLTLVILALFPSIRDQAKDFNQVINQLPEGLRGLKTGGAKSVDVADPVQFLNSQLFYATLPILWIILAITRGNSVLGQDEQNHTIELSLSRPISRTKLLIAKLLSMSAELLFVSGATLLAIIFFAPIFEIRVGTLPIIIATIYTSLFCLSFGLVAFACQAAGKKLRKFAVPGAVLLSFGSYIIASLSGLTNWLEIPVKFAPFHYFQPEKILQNETVTGLNLYLLLTFVSSLIVAYIGFKRRDID